MEEDSRLPPARRVRHGGGAELARAVLDWHGRGEIRYVPFPEELKGRYQSHTEANVTALRRTGCDVAFKDVETGVKSYLDALRDSP